MFLHDRWWPTELRTTAVALIVVTCLAPFNHLVNVSLYRLYSLRRLHGNMHVINTIALQVSRELGIDHRGRHPH